MEPTHEPKNRDIIVANQLQTLSHQIDRLRMMSRAGLTFEGKRDLYEVLGYRRVVTPEHYFEVYRRQDIASRIIRAFPQATWRGNPIIKDGDKLEERTRFQQGIDALNDKVSLWSYCERVDRLSSIGRYGLLVLGVNDGSPLSEPLTAASELNWLKAIKEQNAHIATWNDDPSSPDFGKPLTYSVTFGDSDNQSTRAVTLPVHASRVLHIAEFLEEDEVYGVPRLESVINRLQDLEKVIGGSAEMFWLGARNGLKFIAEKDASFSEPERARLEQMAEDYQHSLRRTLTGQGLDIQSLGTDVANPGTHVDKILDLIAGAVGIPKRILIGSERGELASSQDETNWIGRIEERRINFVEPSIVRALLDKLVALGILEAPSDGEYEIDWEHEDGLSEKERAEIGKIRTEALATYSNAINAPAIVPETEFRENFLGLNPKPDGGFMTELPDIEPDEEEGPEINSLGFSDLGMTPFQREALTLLKAQQAEDDGDE